MKTYYKAANLLALIIICMLHSPNTLAQPCFNGSTITETTSNSCPTGVLTKTERYTLTYNFPSYVVARPRPDSVTRTGECYRIPKGILCTPTTIECWPQFFSAVTRETGNSVSPIWIHHWEKKAESASAVQRGIPSFCKPPIGMPILYYDYSCDAVGISVTAARDHICKGTGGNTGGGGTDSCGPTYGSCFGVPPGGCRDIGSTFLEGACCCPGSPIIIDISRYWDWTTNSGNGYHFTDVVGGVRFDLNGDGIKEQAAWPTATSENAWLALDRNGNGVIDSGKELFGNYTDQVGPAGQPIPSGQGNGWLALAELDRGRSGGNENGMVDRGDAWFANLRLWVDRNHNGISEANELITPASIGLTGIELTYEQTSWTDQYGNNFKFRSRFRWGDVNDGEFFYTEWFKDAWDVFPQWTP